MKSIAIVGGGITGLSAAYWLERETDAKITLFDPNPGGKLITEQADGFTLDLGPDSIFGRKAGALELIKRLGLSGEIVEPQAKQFALFTGGKLHLVPPGLASLASVSPEAVEQAAFLSEDGKERVLNAVQRCPATPRGVWRHKPRATGRGGASEGCDGDLSVAEFFSARYGEEFSRIVAEPLLAGTHAGDPRKLSMAALYPAYLEPTPPPPAEGPTFISFKSGIGRLPARIREELSRTEIHAERVTNIDDLSADHILLALPSNLAAPLVEPLSAHAAEEMRGIRHASSAIVTLAFNRGEIDAPRGTGFLVPMDEDCPITGATWTSNKWPGRSPDDAFLVRVFLGRDGKPDVTSLSDEGLIDRARKGLRQTANIEAEPILTRVTRWPDALPQYEIGHIERVARIRSALSSLPLTVAGTSYDGVGIADCLRQGREAALTIVERLNP